MKKIKIMDCSFRDGFQSCYGARVKTEDFLPALEAAVKAGTRHFEIGGGARFQSLYFYCQEDAFDMMDACRKTVGPDINLQTLGRGANVVGLESQSRDVIDLHAKMFKKHGVSTIRNFDALNDVRNLKYSGKCIVNAGLKHQVVVTLMGLPPGLGKQYPHSAEFYRDTVKQILDADIPFDSLCFKDASGTTPPKIVYDAIKLTREILPAGMEIQFHTHDTADMAISCNMAAIEGGCDIVDLNMKPVSGGTAESDIISMWHRLRGTDYELDVDIDKIIEAEQIFKEQMKKYFMPPEAQSTNPIIPFSPMPGGALTANTQMMRDTNTLHLFPQVIDEMQEVVAKGGFGTSVTPVSQFYFQQAFANVTQGKWKKITEGYGKMVLGYFGKTPSEPDKEIVELAKKQLALEPTTEDVHDINDRNPKLGLKYAKEQLKEAGLEITDENTFIVATCKDKGIEFLKGNKPFGIRYKTDEKASPAASKPSQPSSSSSGSGAYVVTVNGKSYDVTVEEGTAEVTKAVPKASSDSSGSASGTEAVKANVPGKVLKVLVSEGDQVEENQEIMILEAMKMETPVVAHVSGTVSSIDVKKDDVVNSGQTLLTIS